MKRLIASILIATACGLCTTAIAQTAPQARPDIDQLVNAVSMHYHLPGLAVGVIENGKVVYRHVEGKLPSGQPMNADTLFKIGSVTKAMTVTVLARLVQQGKLRWDDPVRQHLPSFGMYDPWVTKHMQVGDLLSHHSGLRGFEGDLMLWPHPSHFTPKDVVKALRYLKPAYSFRAGYAYDNVLFVTAGQLASVVGGDSYAALLRREVFEPLGMDRCQIGTWNRDKVGNVARAHVMHDGHYVPVSVSGSIENATTMDAAGGVSCSLNNMLIWAKNWLAPTPQQLQWLSPVQREAEWTPQTPVPISQRRRAWDGTRFFTNAYGWRVSDADGEMTVWHTGVLQGMRAAIMLLPYRRSGFVVLTNSSADDALTVLDEVLVKHFTAPDKALTVAEYAADLARYIKHDSAPVPDTSSRQPATSTELTSQLGVWKDPWFGEVRICARHDGVRFASAMSPLLSGKVMRVGKRYLVQWDHGDPDAWLEFPIHTGGTLYMNLVDRNADASSDFRDLAFTRERACD
ncbi:MAG TPA: serine hydrolase domain-containing protein [Rhodanobacteraceae bacterium]|nr:serine hydrolase domain-containing protein [Rhodanobacteraceae bacterium]